MLPTTAAFALEPRFMFDAAGAATAADHADQQAAEAAAGDAQAHAAADSHDSQAQSDHAVALDSALAEAVPAAVAPPTVLRGADPSGNEGRTEVVFIDTNVADWQALADGTRAGVEVVLIDARADGLAQMARWAETRSGYDAIHVLSHGSEGKVALGAFQLDTGSAGARAADLAAVGAALSPDGDLLLYGCNVATGAGQDFIQRVGTLSGADVAASTDATGAAARGGDWMLEQASGPVEAAALSAVGYDGLLAAPTIASLGGSVNWAGTAVRLDVGSDATASDADFTGGWTGAMLTVQRSTGAWSADSFGFAASSTLSTSGGALLDNGTPIGSVINTNGSLSILFNGLADAARVSSVLRNITYNNITPAGDAVMRFTLNDGTGAIATADVTVNSAFIYVTNPTDTATVDVTDGVSFSEAMAIADTQAGPNQTLLLHTSLAGQTITLADDVTVGENRTIDTRSAVAAKIAGHSITIANGSRLSVWSDGTTLEIASTLAGAGTLHVRPGTVILSSTGNEAAMSGTIDIQGGAVSISSDDNLSSGTISINTARLYITADGVRIDNTMDMGSGAGNINVGGTNTAYLDGTITGQALNKEGTGTLELTATNSHTNSASVAGTLRVTSAANLGQSFTAIGTVELAASGTYNLPLNLSGGAIVTPAGVSATLTNSFTTFTGSGLTKAGAGTLTLANRTYTYGGATTVSSGMLVLDGSTLSGTSGVTVASGATLTGTGTIFSASSSRTMTVNTGGTLAPGAPGGGTTQLTINGNLVLAAGSTLAVDLKGTVIGTGYDQLRVVGGTASVTNANFQVGLSPTYSPAALDSYIIIQATTVTGTFAGLPGGASAMAGNRNYTAGYSGGFFTLTGPNNIGPTINDLDGDIVAWAGVGNTVRLDGGSSVVTASDADAANWGGAVLTVQRAGGAVATDQFGFDTSGTIFSVGPSTVYVTSDGTVLANYTQSGGVLTLTFTTDALTSRVTQVLRNLTYRNDTPYGDAQISVKLMDRPHAFTTATVTVASSAIYVTKTDDDSDDDLADGVSLREALARGVAQAGADTIHFAGPVSSGSTITLAGSPATLGAGDTIRFSRAGSETLTIAQDTGGGLALAGTGTLSVDAGETLTVSAAISGTGDLVKEGAGTLAMSGANSHTGSTTVDDGTLLVDGTLNGSGAAGVTVEDGGTLAGTGTVNGNLLVDYGGTLAPGVAGTNDGVGALTIDGDLVMASGSTLAVDIAGASSHDGVAVNGTVDVTGATLSLSGSHTVTTATGGESFVVIDNDGIDAITGTFNGLAEGGTVLFNAVNLTGGYSAGTNGNDFRLIGPVAPVLGGSFTTAGTVDDNGNATPFSGVTFTDADGTTGSFSVGITYTAANGTLASDGGGLTGTAGNYTLTASTPGALQTLLQALVFTPTSNQVTPGGTVATSFTLTPSDGTNTGNSDATTLFTATSINDAPTDIALTGGTVTVYDTTNSSAGTLSATDADTGAVFTYSIADIRSPSNGAVANDGSVFNISGNSLRATDPDSLATGSYTITVEVSDGTVSFQKEVTVTVGSDALVVTTSSDSGAGADTESTYAAAIADDGFLSLREALFLARNGGKTIGFAASLDGGQTITLGGDAMVAANTIFQLDPSGTAGVTISANTLLLSGALTVNAGDSDTLTIDSAMNGTDGLIKNGTGTLLLGSNTLHTDLAGGVGLTGGTLGIADGRTLPNGSVAMADGTTLAIAGDTNATSPLGGGTAIINSFSLTGTTTIEVASTRSATILGVISGTGTLSKEGAGTLALTPKNSTGTLDQSNGMAGVAIAGGTLAVTRGEALGSGTITFSNDATLLATVTTGTSTTLGNLLTGTGTLSKAGSGALALSNIGNAGATDVKASVSAGSLEVDSSTMVTGDVSLSGGALTFTGDGTYGNAVSLTGDATIAADANATLSGAISGSGGLTTGGSGTLTLTGDNSGFTGAITLDEGTLVAGGDNALGSSGAGTTVSSGATLVIGSGVTVADALTINGTGVGSAGAIQVLSGTGAISGTVTLATAATIDVASGAGLSVTGALSDGGNTRLLTKTGAGTLSLGAAASNHSGGVTINGGTVEAGTDTALGSGTLTLNGGTLEATANRTLANAVNVTAGSGISVATGATLSLSGGVTGTSALSKTGTGTLLLSNASSTYSGTITLAGTVTLSRTLSADFAFSDAAATLAIDNSSTVILGGTITGLGSVTKSGSGGLTLNTAAKSWSGGLTISAGTVSAGAANLIGTGTITMSGGTLSLSNALAITNAFDISGNATISNSGAVTLSGARSGTGGLTKGGAGTLTLDSSSSGQHSHSGGITVSAGTLQAKGGWAIGNAAAVTLNGTATLELRNNETIGRLVGAGGTATVEINANTLSMGDGNDTTFDGVISGTGGGITKTGTGALTLTGANSYTGATTVSDGTLIVDNGDAITDASAVTVSSGASLKLDDNETIGSLTGEGTVTLDGGSLTVGGDNGSTIFSGVIAEGGSPQNLIKQGGGTLTLSGANSYTGTTTVTNGALSVGADANLGSGTVTLDGGTLIVTGSTANIDNAFDIGAAGATVEVAGEAEISGIIGSGGSNAVIKTGTGTLTLSAASTYTGDTMISDGTLLLTGSLASGLVVVDANGTLGGTGTVNGNVTAPGTLAPGGAGAVGTLTIDGNLNLGGTLKLDLASASSYDRLAVTGTVLLSAGATLDITNTVTGGTGSTFVVIENDGTDAITNTLAGVAEGETLTSNGRDYKVSYTGGTDGNDLTLQDNAAPAFTSTAPTTADEDGGYSYTVTATDADGDTLTITATSLPSWLSFSGNVLSGTPLQADVGTHSVVLQADDGKGGITTQTFTVTVTAVNDTPVVTSTPVTAANEDSAYSYTPTASDEEGQTVTWTATTLPSWLSFSGGVLSGTPAQADVGSHTVVLTATDASSAGTPHSFTIIVTAVNDAPVVTSTPVTAVNEDSAYSYTPAASDEEGQTVTWTATTLPSWLSLSGGVLSGTPAQADVGAHSVVLQADDGHGGITTQTFTITVAAVNDAPIVTSIPRTAAGENRPYSYTPAASDEEGQTVTWSATTLPSWLRLTDGVLSGTPGQADAGTHTVVLVGTDAGGASVTQTFTVTVNAVNDAPVVTSTPATGVNQGAAYRYTLAASDKEGQSITYAATTLPSWMRFSNGVLSGTPDAGDIGGHSVALTATDASGAVTTQTFSVTVNGAPVAGAANTPSATVTQGDAYRYTPGFSDPEGQTVTVTASTLPGWLSFSNGVLSGTPGAGDIGSHTVVLTATDAAGAVATQTFTIAVTTTVTTNIAPSFTSGSQAGPAAAGQAYSFTITTADPTDDTRHIAASGLPGWLTLTDNGDGTATLSGTPGRNDVGSLTVTLTVTDARGAATTQALSVAVFSDTTPGTTPNITQSNPSTTATGFTSTAGTGSGTVDITPSVATTGSDTGSRTGATPLFGTVLGNSSSTTDLLQAQGLTTTATAGDSGASADGGTLLRNAIRGDGAATSNFYGAGTVVSSSLLGRESGPGAAGHGVGHGMGPGFGSRGFEEAEGFRGFSPGGTGAGFRNAPAGQSLPGTPIMAPAGASQPQPSPNGNATTPAGDAPAGNTSLPDVPAADPPGRDAAALDPLSVLFAGPADTATHTAFTARIAGIARSFDAQSAQLDAALSALDRVA